MKPQILLGAVIASLAFALTASAEPGAGGPGKGPGPDKKPDLEKIFDRFDTDGDQRLSKTEAEAGPRGHLAKNFDRIDANGDGFLTVEEMREKGKAAREKMQEKRGMWKDADADGNGSLSYEEVELSGNERLLEHFATVDTNGDGALTPEELRNAKQNRKKGAPAEE